MGLFCINLGGLCAHASSSEISPCYKDAWMLGSLVLHSLVKSMEGRMQ
jgi:hypothetical protein